MIFVRRFSIRSWFWAIPSLGILFTLQASASLEDITYPIAELGGCESQEACFSYCGDPANFDACMSFAQANDLLEEEDIERYETAQAALAATGGPGGCTTQADCETYCSDLVHLDECLSFAESNGLMSEEELAEARQIQAALDAGYSLPGGCTDEASCESYCSDASHMEECLAFGQAAGFITEEEAAQAEQFLSIMETGSTPGGCQSGEECEAYCADEANAEECLNFAVEAGIMTQEEADVAREMGMQPPDDFVGPGGCTDEESCRAYCGSEEHQEECQSFFGEMGSEYEGEGGSEDFVGPGGCVGEEACRAYCSDAANQETCAAFFGETHEPEYQYEGGQGYELYDDSGEGSYPYDQEEFEFFDPGGSHLDLGKEFLQI